MTKYTPEDITSRLDRYPNKTRSRPYGKIPFGYKASEGDPLTLIPDIPFLCLLEEAFDMIEGGLGFREVTPWLNEAASTPLIYQTLNNLYRRHRKPFVNYSHSRKKQPKSLKLKGVDKKISSAKRSVTTSIKALQKLEAEKRKKNPPKVPESSSSSPTPSKTPDQTLVPDSVKIIFQPNPGPQTLFLAAPELEVLYGGAAGGGKSYALLADPMRYFHHKEFRGLLVRRTNDELRELKQKSKELYPLLFKGAKFSEVNSTWTFPSGATLWMTYLERDDDVHRYQGQAFTWIGFDELTHWPTPFAWNYLRSRLRTTADLPLSMRATTNPGGVGHHWVKKMFIDPAEPNTPFPATDIETNKPLLFPMTHPRAGEPLFFRKFIPASLYDNPYLLKDGQYEQNLLSLSDAQREKLLYGNWDIVEGAAFPEFNRLTHVIKPFEIPDEWRKFRSCDYGYASNTAVLWFAIDPGDRLYVYRELYVSKFGPEKLAQEIMRAERMEKIQYGVLDSSVWHRRGEGPSPAEKMISLGCRWRPADRSPGSRTNGFTRLHDLLAVNDITDEPSIFFFNTCRQTLTDLPSIPLDPNGKDDIDDKYPSDHTYDALRYGVMSRPSSISPFESWHSDIPKPTFESPSDITFGY